MADNNTILEKLEGLVARFEEVSTLITDPAVIADQKRYVKLTKEYKELGDLMNARKEYMQVLRGIEEAKEIIANETDQEMREMAREELDACQTRQPELEEQIKLLLVPADPPSSKFVAARVVTKRQSLPATSSACTPSTANPRDGKWRYPAPTKAQPAVSRKLSAP
mgnify:CR=1 FL=1